MVTVYEAIAELREKVDTPEGQELIRAIKDDTARGQASVDAGFKIVRSPSAMRPLKSDNDYPPLRPLAPDGKPALRVVQSDAKPR